MVGVLGLPTAATRPDDSVAFRVEHLPGSGHGPMIDRDALRRWGLAAKVDLISSGPTPATLTSYRRRLNPSRNRPNPARHAIGASLRRELDKVRADVGEVRRDVHDVSDRVARIEGALTGSAGPGAVAATGPVQRQMAAG